jgi:hypothetical protein
MRALLENTEPKQVAVALQFRQVLCNLAFRLILELLSNRDINQMHRIYRPVIPEIVLLGKGIQRKNLFCFIKASIPYASSRVDNCVCGAHARSIVVHLIRAVEKCLGFR